LFFWERKNLASRSYNASVEHPLNCICIVWYCLLLFPSFLPLLFFFSSKKLIYDWKNKNTSQLRYKLLSILYNCYENVMYLMDDNIYIYDACNLPQQKSHQCYILYNLLKLIIWLFLKSSCVLYQKSRSSPLLRVLVVWIMTKCCNDWNKWMQMKM
jgi:hypothetical protein